MKRMVTLYIKITSISILINMLIIGTTFAQESAAKQDLKHVISTLNNRNDSLAMEKIYLQTDKSVYAAGDTLWFKTYLFNAATLNYSKKSGMMYVEISTDSNILMKRIMMPMYSGLMFGNITLDEDIPHGNYQIRAYTSWILNFEEQNVFLKRIYIGGAKDQEWLVNYKSKVVKGKAEDNIQLSLKFSQWDKIPVGLRDFQMLVADEKKNWAKNKVQTTYDGLLNVNFDFPEKIKAKNISLQVQDLRKGQGERKLKIPLILNRPDQIDLQFMAEGGSPIATITTQVAFKALNEDGTGTKVSGKIVDSKGKELTEFRSNRLGIGAFTFLPQSNEIYSARMTLSDGSYKTYPLPLIKTSGTALRINNPLESDSCEVIINATSDQILGRTYYLLALCRGTVCYSASFSFHNREIKRKINKRLFPSGITQFMLVTPDKKVLNERIIYIDNQDDLSIQVTANKPFFKQRDSVMLNIKVSDKEGNPVQGNFSMAVTDDGQVKTDSVKNTSILLNVLLTSQLKGTVEDPGYYSGASKNAEKWQNLDLLLLSQGWVNYAYEDAFKPAKDFKYVAEPEFEVRGKILNVFNKPIPNSGVSLFSKKPLLIIDTVTNNAGVFSFKGLFPVDTARFFVQARNKKGKAANVIIEMDEFKPPVFSTIPIPLAPWYVNIDTTDLMLAEHQVKLKMNYDHVTGKTNVLKEVVINEKKIVKDSENINGPGNADQVINGQELEKSGKMNLEDLMTKYIKGFMKRPDNAAQSDKSGTDHPSGTLNYFVNEKRVYLVVDGMDIEFWRPEGVSPGDNIKTCLQYFDAEDIKGIEVMTSGKYQVSYSFRFFGGNAKPWETAFIEVTTRTGKGPLIKKKLGTYLYKPIPFSLPKLFYSPKYSAATVADGSDIRSTIFWEPNIVTDKEGKARLNFYTADNPGVYTFIIEGADMQGALGSQSGKLVVEKP